MSLQQSLKSTVQLVNGFVAFGRGTTAGESVDVSLHEKNIFLFDVLFQLHCRREKPTLLFFFLFFSFSAQRYPLETSQGFCLLFRLCLPLICLDPLLNKALWNTIYTNRHRTSYFHPLELKAGFGGGATVNNKKTNKIKFHFWHFPSDWRDVHHWQQCHQRVHVCLHKAQKPAQSSGRSTASCQSPSNTPSNFLFALFHLYCPPVTVSEPRHLPLHSLRLFPQKNDIWCSL